MTTRDQRRAESEIAWAERKADTYAGPNCDEIADPFWWTYFEGDKDADSSKLLELEPKAFPPGTRVTITAPDCPECGISSDFSYDQETGKSGPCECGFDWEEWVRAKYE